MNQNANPNSKRLSNQQKSSQKLPRHDFQPKKPGVIAFATSYLKDNPQLTMDFKRIIAEGEYVVVHSHQKRNPQDRGDAIVDIFRVQDGKLVEHWDVIQPVPVNPTNRNAMF